MRSDAAMCSGTPVDPHPAAHNPLAGLVNALTVGEYLRAHSVDPALHAAVEALTAAARLLAATARPVPPVSPGSPGSSVLTDRPREAVLQDALDSTRAASAAIRFALAEEGDRQRSLRNQGDGSAGR